jgi:hypothetical protein
MKKFKFVIILIIISLLYSPVMTIKQAAALDFDPNLIITNEEMFDAQSMGLTDIQAFLNVHNGILKNYRINDHQDIERSAAEIIYNAAQTYNVSAKWILATLQKEQSLITNPSPSQYNLDWAMGYAVCDSCSVDDPQVALFKGFGTQVDRATWRIKYYSENPDKFNFKVGSLYSVDGRDVLIYNQATANLFIYTPHIHGNYNFWLIWHRWFAKIYPDGSLLQEIGQPGVWVLSNGKRRPIWSKTALMSRFDTSKIIEVSKTDLQRYEIGYPIKYSNYSLLKSPANKIYLTVNDEKKEIESDEVFKAIGYHPDEVIEVTSEELSYYKEGRKITLKSLYPQGALLQDNKSGGVYYVEDGIKYPIIDKEILLASYQDYKITQVSSEELAQYVTAATGVGFKDGSLIKSSSDSKVYVVSNNKRRWVANEYTFSQLNYKWYNIMEVSDKVMALHPEGEILDLFFGGAAKIAF